jgi:hypothetical protein
MSGTRHHFIPQFLLRGFASHSIGEATYTWVYRKDRPPFNPNIINIGVEGDFYTHENSSDVDDSITAIEGKLGYIVNELRRTESTDFVSNAEMAWLFAHLEIRTRHLRENFEKITSEVLNQSLRFVLDEVAFGEFILRKFEANPSLLYGPLADEIRNAGVPENMLPSAIELIRPRLPSLLKNILPSLVTQFSQAMLHASKQKPALLHSAARTGQLRALREATAPDTKVARYSALRYQILKVTREPVPLGDSIVLARIDAPRQYTSFVTSDDQLISLYLPLSPSTILCGQSADFLSSADDLGAAITKCSLEYYVAHERSPQLTQYQSNISELAEILDRGTIEHLLMEAFND